MPGFGVADLPNPRATNCLVFPGQFTTNAPGWIPWTIPRNASMIFMAAVGGGGGGGGGFSAGAGVGAGGGAGGGAAAMARMLIPARFLPRVLYMSAGAGGAAVGAATAGNPGVLSMISSEPSTAPVAGDLVLISGTVPAQGGGVGTGSAGGIGGAGETVATQAQCSVNGFGIWKAIAGEAGGAGGPTAGTGGVGGTWGTAGIFCLSGGGGGGCNTTTTTGAGGAMTGGGLVKTIAGGTNAGGAGNPGYGINARLDVGGRYGDFPWQMFASMGGSGGGGKASGTAGAGGQAGWASGGGGGGGGGGTSGGTGGGGGAGGPGFIYVVWW